MKNRESIETKRSEKATERNYISMAPARWQLIYKNDWECKENCRHFACVQIVPPKRHKNKRKTKTFIKNARIVLKWFSLNCNYLFRQLLFFSRCEVRCWFFCSFKQFGHCVSNFAYTRCECAHAHRILGIRSVWQPLLLSTLITPARFVLYACSALSKFHFGMRIGTRWMWPMADDRRNKRFISNGAYLRPQPTITTNSQCRLSSAAQKLDKVMIEFLFDVSLLLLLLLFVFVTIAWKRYYLVDYFSFHRINSIRLNSTW